MTIALAMIVRDASATIRGCLDAARPLIDTWTIVDTGSADGTQEIVREALADLPGQLYEREWRNFAHNRSEMLALAHGSADRLLMLDADMVLEQRGPLPELTADVGLVRLEGNNLDYALPVIINGHKEWEYRGYAHSYLVAKDGRASRQEIRELVIHDHSSTGQEKIERDVELLTQELADNPNDPRATFYLAQSYKDLDRYDEAVEWYQRRAELGGFDEERYYALYQAGALMVEHQSFSKGAELLLEAWRMRPSRAEALRVLGHSAHNVADKIPYPDDILFVHRNAYAKPRPSGLRSDQVSAVIVTRGNVDLEPILETLPYPDIVVYDNSKRDHDLKVYGRYAAIAEAKNDVIYLQDDDIIFRRHDELLAAYEPGKIVANMDQSWIDGAGYGDLLVLLGAGSLHDKGMHEDIFRCYLEAHGDEYDEFLLECDFVFGVLAPWKRVDLSYEVRPFAGHADRLYRQPGQTQAKWRAITQALALKEAA